MVGVVPNAAYRHFADRDALLAAVRDYALQELARSMADGMDKVRAPAGSAAGARLRMRAVGTAYLAFARQEPGLFDTAFTATHHPVTSRWPLERLQSALDDLVRAGLLDPARRPDIEYPTWAAVHGFAVLLRGPLHSLPEQEQIRLGAAILNFIGAAVAP